MGNIMKPKEKPITIREFYDKYPEEKKVENKQHGIDTIMRAEAEGHNIAVSYPKRSNNAYITLSDEEKLTKVMIKVPNEGDMVRNICLYNKTGVERATLQARNIYTNMMTKIKALDCNTDMSLVDISFDTEFFPQCATRYQELIVILSLDPVGLENLINGNIFIEAEQIMITSNMRCFLRAHPIALPKNDIVIYADHIYSTYRSYLDRINQPGIIDRLTTAFDKFLLEDEPETEDKRSSNEVDMDIC